MGIESMATAVSGHVAAMRHVAESLARAESKLVAALGDGAIDAALLDDAAKLTTAAFDQLERTTPFAAIQFQLPTRGMQTQGAPLIAIERLLHGRTELARTYLQRGIDGTRHAREGVLQVADAIQRPLATTDDLIARLQAVPSNAPLSAAIARVGWNELSIEAKSVIAREGQLRGDITTALRDMERGHAFESAFANLDGITDNTAAAGRDALVGRLMLDQSGRELRRLELSRILSSGDVLAPSEAFELRLLDATSDLGDVLEVGPVESRRQVLAAYVSSGRDHSVQAAWSKLPPSRQAELVPDEPARAAFSALVDELARHPGSIVSPERRIGIEILTKATVPNQQDIVARLLAAASTPRGSASMGEHTGVLHDWLLLADDAPLPAAGSADHARLLARVIDAHGAVGHGEREWRIGLERALRASSDAAATLREDAATAPLADTVEQLAARNLGRLDGTITDGWGRHPDYAELGRLVQAFDLADAMRAGDGSAAAASTLLAW